MRRLLLLLLIACDGGQHRTLYFDAATAPDGDGMHSGVSRDERIVAISASEMMQFCAWLIPLQGPERTIDCPGGTTVTTGTSNTIAQCVAEGTDFQAMNPSCESTVGQYEDCLLALDALTDMQICDSTIPPACGPLFNPSPACGGSGT
jgi:hypothetical protein